MDLQYAQGYGVLPNGVLGDDAANWQEPVWQLLHGCPRDKKSGAAEEVDPARKHTAQAQPAGDGRPDHQS